jgi:hypothetical protein
MTRNNDNEQPSERPTVAAWPPSRLPVPRVFRPRIDAIDGEVLVLELPSAAASDVVTIPEELFLRELLDIDLGDVGSISEFTAQFGLLLYSRAREIGSGSAAQRFWSPRRDLEQIRRDLTEELRSEMTRLKAAGTSEESARRAGRPIVALLLSVQAQLESGRGPGAISVHADDFRLLAAEYRDLARIWLDTAMGASVHREKWESPHLEPPEDPPAFLSTRLDGDLRRFTPRLFPAKDAGVGRLEETWSLDAALAAQLFNDIVEPPAYRRCALEDCGRVFARARGRSERGRHRSDAKFCSKSCADLAMKRRQRARRSSV